MRLILNEQEIVDGICVYVANGENIYPEDVEVKELSYNKHMGFLAEAKFGRHHTQLVSDDISEGIIQFLEEYHNFNPDLMVVELKYDETLGFYAEVLVNEGEDQCFHLL
ncbi:YxcD family protein [Alkalihalobacillus gibsonii]|nr:YxcD family protein [Alkalicoccobacillus gibsonii]